MQRCTLPALAIAAMLALPVAVHAQPTPAGQRHFPEAALRGQLTIHSSAEARLIARKPSSDFERLLGYSAEPEMIHRDNLVLV